MATGRARAGRARAKDRHCDAVSTGARDTGSEPFSANGSGQISTEKKDAMKLEDLAMERIVIVSILSAVLAQLATARATAEGDYKKICRVSENLRVLDDRADANSCRTIAVNSQAQEYQIGCRDGENTGTVNYRPSHS
jgi:hypothetical protein